MSSSGCAISSAIFRFSNFILSFYFVTIRLLFTSPLFRYFMNIPSISKSTITLFVMKSKLNRLLPPIFRLKLSSQTFLLRFWDNPNFTFS